VTSPARKKAPPRPPAEPVVLPTWMLAFARREGPLARLARESGRGNAHFGLNAAGDVILSDGDGDRYGDHVSYPLGSTCPRCHYDPADDPAWVNPDGTRKPLPSAFVDACPKCGHPALTFAPRGAP
jgi:hypothetical protein